MFSLGAKQTPPIIKQIPHIPMLQENNVREGFFTKEEFHRLVSVLPKYLKPVIGLAFKTGMRKEEILSLTWKQIDLKRKMLRLTDTKTGEPRNIPLTGSLPTLIKWQKKRAEANDIKLPYVFLNKDGTDRIKDFRGAWDTACQKAKLGKRLFHDFRRTAVRNMVRAGVPEKVAMRISGHKTRSVFDRYHIVDEKDLTKAMEKTETFLREEDEPPENLEFIKRRIKKLQVIETKNTQI